jgi:hypothetical protein
MNAPALHLTHEEQGRRAAIAASTWNTRHNVGVRVVYVSDHRGPIFTVTRSRAQVLGGHSAVIWLENVTGCVALERVTAMGAVQ